MSLGNIIFENISLKSNSVMMMRPLPTDGDRKERQSKADNEVDNHRTVLVEVIFIFAGTLLDYVKTAIDAK